MASFVYIPYFNNLLFTRIRILCIININTITFHKQSVIVYRAGGTLMKMHSKRFISSLVAFILMLISCLSHSNCYAFALQTKGKAGENAYWEWNQDTLTLSISGLGDMYDYKFKYIELTPEEGGGFTDGITAPWRPYINKMKNIIISNGITSIGDYAFKDSACESVIIPTSVVRIGFSAFATSALKEVTVLNPNTEFSEGSCLFYYSAQNEGKGTIYGFKGSTAEQYAESTKKTFKALKTTGRCGDQISWKYDAESQALSLSGTGAMNDYSEENRPPWYPYINEINSISLSEGIVSIGNYAFNKLSFLENVEIPNTVQMIGNNAFANCSNIISITMNFGPETIGKEAFSDCVNLKQIAIPEGVKTIEEGAFYGCSSLTSIITPLSTSCIDENAFSHCTHLAEITILNPEANIFNSQSTISDSDISSAVSAASDLKDGLESQRADLTPTFDLDQLASDAQKANGIVMSSLMAAQNASIGDYINQDSELNPFMKDRWQNVYNFTQNNYSPKALSRIDIYRQTQRQLGMSRGF